MNIKKIIIWALCIKLRTKSDQFLKYNLKTPVTYVIVRLLQFRIKPWNLFKIKNALPRCDISMYKIQRFQILHPRSDLRPHIKQTIERQRLHAVRQSVTIIWRDVRLKKLAQIAVLQILHNDTNRFFVAANPKNSSDIRVLERG